MLTRSHRVVCSLLLCLFFSPYVHAQDVDPMIQQCVEGTFRSFPNTAHASECKKIKNLVDFTPADRGGDSPVTSAGYRLVHDLEDWRALWKDNHKATWDLPKVDFNRVTVIAIFGGLKSVPEGLTDDSQFSLEFLQKTDAGFKLYLAKMEPDSKLVPRGTKLSTTEVTPYAFYIAPDQIQKIDILTYHSKSGTWQHMAPGTVPSK